MARFGGIHTIHITPETDQKMFETFMLKEPLYDGLHDSRVKTEKGNEL